MAIRPADATPYTHTFAARIERAGGSVKAFARKAGAGSLAVLAGAVAAAMLLAATLVFPSSTVGRAVRAVPAEIPRLFGLTPASEAAERPVTEPALETDVDRVEDGPVAVSAVPTPERLAVLAADVRPANPASTSHAWSGPSLDTDHAKPGKGSGGVPVTGGSGDDDGDGDGDDDGDGEGSPKPVEPGDDTDGDDTDGDEDDDVSEEKPSKPAKTSKPAKPSKPAKTEKPKKAAGDSDDDSDSDDPEDDGDEDEASSGDGSKKVKPKDAATQGGSTSPSPKPAKEEKTGSAQQKPAKEEKPPKGEPGDDLVTTG